MSLLERVDSPADLRRLSIGQLAELAREIRGLIIETTARTGGHTAPSLGVVELTLALHYVFDTPRDRLIWDVGHQCYAHKIITGRRDAFPTLRQPGGIAGFPKRAESEYDVLDTGHSGDSIGTALGAAIGARLLGEDRKSIAVVGDGSIVAGMAFEALNHAGELKQDLVVILNDNKMSIARSTGAMAAYLNRMISGRTYDRMREDAWNLLGLLPDDLSGRARVAARRFAEGLKSLVLPSLLFEELGFRYFGPVPGHDLGELVRTLRRVRALRGPMLVHVVTKKGMGYAPAMEHPEPFHGTGPFDPESGERLGGGGPTFTGTFGSTLVRLAEHDDRVVVITPGMCLGSGLAAFRERLPNRFFDVGICEQHAVALAAGLALAGLRPVVAVYSTFLQRAVDQVIGDICLQRLPVVFAVDRAGIVGEDGPTHHGMFDLVYLGMMPNLVVMAPRDEVELDAMLVFALDHLDGPIAVRYPRGGSGSAPAGERPPIALGRAEVLRRGGHGNVLAIGSMVLPSLAAADELARTGLELTVVNARFARPLDLDVVRAMASGDRPIVTVEEGVLAGGFGSAVARVVEEAGGGRRVRRLGLSDRFIEHGRRDGLLAQEGLSPGRLAERFREIFRA